jgi:hypothetical protein
MLEINLYNDLTNEFILQISDELFSTTMAYNSFTKKQMFINKIHDTQVRYMMLKNILVLVSMEK